MCAHLLCFTGGLAGCTLVRLCQGSHNWLGLTHPEFRNHNSSSSQHTPLAGNGRDSFSGWQASLPCSFRMPRAGLAWRPCCCSRQRAGQWWDQGNTHRQRLAVAGQGLTRWSKWPLSPQMASRTDSQKRQSQMQIGVGGVGVPRFVALATQLFMQHTQRLL